jgi:hypothetical protein
MSTDTTPIPSSDDHEAASFDAAVFDSAVRHCFEKIDRLAERLQRYPLEAIALAMGAYLQEVLGFLLEDGACTGDEIRQYLRDFESGILEPKGSTAENESAQP